ncbi:hypothetical protein P9112_013493 [Eukaryota sp. TZLM1-RC]
MDDLVLIGDLNIVKKATTDLHDAVCDVTYEMFKCYNFSCKVQPLLKHYSDNFLFNSRLGDLIVPFVDSSEVVDFTTIDPVASIYGDVF